jgi:hypothetical protein
VSVAGSRVTKQLPRLRALGHVGDEPVAGVGQPLHQRVAVLAADADPEERDLLGRLLADPTQDRIGRGVADVGEAVGEEDDPVARPRDVAVASNPVSGHQTGLEVGAAVGAQLTDRAVQGAAVARRRHLPQHMGRVVERDDRHRVARPELVDEHIEGVLHQVQSAGLGHRTGDVDDERQSGIGPLGRVVGPGLQADPQQAHVPAVAVAVRAGQPRSVHADGEALAAGLRVVLTERVDELLRAHGRRVGTAAVEQLPAGEVVRGGVDVDGEGGLRLLGDVDLATDAGSLPAAGRRVRVGGRRARGAAGTAAGDDQGDEEYRARLPDVSLVEHQISSMSRALCVTE